jgi:chromosomal replication initiator protein
MGLIVPKQDGFQLPSSGMSFDNLAHDNSTLLTYNVMRRVGESTVTSLNPLVIHGQSGVGKTHYLHAVVKSRAMQGQDKILYRTAEQFMFEFASALQAGQGLDFKARNYSAHMIFIDDAQFFARKEHTLAEFMYLLEHGIGHDKQVIISINEAPGTLQGIPENLRSRLQGGLVLDIRPPDHDLRKQIVYAHFGKKIKGVIDDDVIDLIVAAVASPNQLIGIMHKLCLASEVYGFNIDQSRAEELLHHELREANKKVTIKKIIGVVCGHFSVSERDIHSSNRERKIARPRQIIMYLARKMIGLSYPQIGEALGKRDHTTIMYGVQHIAELCEEDLILKHEIEELERQLKGSHH